MWPSQGQGQDGQMRWPLVVWGHWGQICLFQVAENNSEEETDTSALITMMKSWSFTLNKPTIKSLLLQLVLALIQIREIFP